MCMTPIGTNPKVKLIFRNAAMANTAKVRTVILACNVVRVCCMSPNINTIRSTAMHTTYHRDRKLAEWLKMVMKSYQASNWYMSITMSTSYRNMILTRNIVSVTSIAIIHVYCTWDKSENFIDYDCKTKRVPYQSNNASLKNHILIGRVA